MNDAPDRRAPPLLLGVAVFGTLLLLVCRGTLFDKGSPVVFATVDPGVRVEFGPGLGTPGVHQFSDGSSLLDVISLTMSVPGTELQLAEACPETVRDGLALDIQEKTAQIQCGWMSAEHRIALRIPLHPDRMSVQDWQALPGLGPVLAGRIEADRQNNGDFRRFEAVQRVKGVGPKRIESWKEFFYAD